MVLQLVLFIVATFLVLLALVLFINSLINKSPRFYPDPRPPRPPRPGALCPSLVKIEIDLPGYVPMDNNYWVLREYKPTGVGFIVNSEEGLTTVWGQSCCLYDPDIYETKGLKVLREVAKVTVVLQDKENVGTRCYDGVVTYVDFDFDLAIIVIKHPNFKELPRLGNFVEKGNILSCDFHHPMNRYALETYALKSIEGDDDDESPTLHKCGPYYHVNWKYWHTPGVLLDINLNIVGMKFGICHSAYLSHSKELAHVLPIQEIVARLHEKSQSNDHTDIQPRTFRIDDKSQDGRGGIPIPDAAPLGLLTTDILTLPTGNEKDGTSLGAYHVMATQSTAEFQNVVPQSLVYYQY